MTEPATPGRPGLAGWPVNLVVEGRRVVVVGAGRVAARKIEPLVELGADVVVVAPRIDTAIRRLATHAPNGPDGAGGAGGPDGAGGPGRVELAERAFVASDLEGAWLVVTATDDPAVNASVAREAEAARIWCNSADDPDNCSFTLMSVVRRADLVVAIGSGGRSPALASWLKRHVQEEMGPEYATLLDLLSEAREAIRGEGRSTSDADWQRAFESGIVELVRSGRIDEAKELLSSCL